MYRLFTNKTAGNCVKELQWESQEYQKIIFDMFEKYT